MALILKAATGGDFEPAPVGVWQAVCVDVVDLGMVETTWQGETKTKHMLRVVWQLEEAMENGKPFIVASRYTASLHEKARLRADLEAWRGRAFTEAELAGFDVESVIGANCLINVTHRASEKTGKTFANVASIMPLRKGMEKLTGRDYVRVCDRTEAQTSHAAQHDEPEPPLITEDDIPF